MIDIAVALLAILPSIVLIHVGCFQKHRRYARDRSSPVSKEIL